MTCYCKFESGFIQTSRVIFFRVPFGERLPILGFLNLASTKSARRLVVVTSVFISRESLARVSLSRESS
jgi:hypothetical protein